MKLEDLFTAEELKLIDSGEYSPGRAVLDAKLALWAAIEREACAKVCEDNEVCIHLKGGKSLRPRFKDDGSGCDGDVYAAAIRARGQA